MFSTEEIETLALNDVDFEVQNGEFVAIMGPSGCGKSTLLNIIGLLDNPSSGSYFLDGKDVTNFREIQRTNNRKGNNSNRNKGGYPLSDINFFNFFSIY